MDAAVIDRTEASRALAKAIAYAACGKPDLADAEARRLVAMLAAAGVIKRGV